MNNCREEKASFNLENPNDSDYSNLGISDKIYNCGEIKVEVEEAAGTHDVTEKKFLMGKLEYKAGFDGTETEQKTIKLDDHLNQAGHGDGHRNGNVTLDSKCGANIKQEIDINEKVELMIDEHYINEESGECLNVKMKSEEPIEFDEGFCDTRAETKRSLKHLKLEYNMIAEWYHCLLCTHKTKYKRNLKQHHLAKHLNEDEWLRCQVCDFKTKHAASLKRHSNLKHSESAEWYQCKFCDFITKQKNSLKRHFTAKHDEEAEWYQCQLCDYGTKHQPDLRRHFRVLHDNEAEWYHCNDCDYRTKDKNPLRRHLKTKHNRMKDKNSLR